MWKESEVIKAHLFGKALSPSLEMLLPAITKLSTIRNNNLIVISGIQAICWTFLFHFRSNRIRMPNFIWLGSTCVLLFFWLRMATAHALIFRKPTERWQLGGAACRLSLHATVSVSVSYRVCFDYETFFLFLISSFQIGTSLFPLKTLLACEPFGNPAIDLIY